MHLGVTPGVGYYPPSRVGRDCVWQSHSGHPTRDGGDLAVHLGVTPGVEDVACHDPDLLAHDLRVAYRGTSPIRNSAPLGPYSNTMPKAL